MMEYATAGISAESNATGISPARASWIKWKTEQRKKKLPAFDYDTWRVERRMEQIKKQVENDGIKRTRHVEKRMKHINAMDELRGLGHRLEVSKRIRDKCRRLVRSNGRHACDVQALKSSEEMVRRLEHQIRALPSQHSVPRIARRIHKQGSGHTSKGYDILSGIGCDQFGGRLSM